MAIKRIIARTCLVAILLIVAVGGWWCLRAHQGLAKAEQLVELGLWPGVRHQVTRYLWLHPNDSAARLLLAQAWVKDNSLDSAEAATAAVAELEKIADDDASSAEARAQQGRLEFLVLCRPERAEELFRRAIQLDPNANDARYLLWKVFDQTERSHLAAPVFWEFYERTPIEGRAAYLREWYMSQLFPVSANAYLDRQMGFLDPGHGPSFESQGKRLAYFKNSDPSSPLAYAALTRWFHKQGDVPYASRLIADALQNIDCESSHSFFVATRLNVLLDLGDFEQAKAVFAQWPEPRAGFEYFRWSAIVRDEVDGDYAGAIEAYEKALALWPGPFEWRLWNRLANCLSRVGRREEAGEVRKRARAIEQMMEETVHERLRQMLADLEHPQNLGELLAFYEDLDCEREVQAWKDVLRRLGADHAVVETEN